MFLCLQTAGFLKKQKSEILNYHLKHNSFYKNHVAGSNGEWDALPVLTKSDLQQPLQNRLSEGFTSKNVHIHKTSGSSGHPFIFAKDKFAHALTWASIQDLYQGQGIASNSYEARFYGIPNAGLAHYKERLKDLMSNRYRFSIFDASPANFEAFIRRFKSKPFGHLNASTITNNFFGYIIKSQRIPLFGMKWVISARSITKTSCLYSPGLKAVRAITPFFPEEKKCLRWLFIM